MGLSVLIQRHSWCIHLLGIFSLAYGCACLASAFLEGALLPPVPHWVDDLPATDDLPAHIAKPDRPIDATRLAKLLGLSAEDETPQDRPPASNAELARSNLPVHLLGTLLAEVPENSLAAILDSTTQRAQTYRPGDKLAEAEVVEIQRRRVIIFNKRLEFIDVVDHGAGPLQRPPSPGPSSGSPTAGIQVRPLSDHEYELRRDELNELLANANDLLTQARFMPEARNGSAPGFRALSIRPDSFFAKIGLRGGDLIRRVNGYDLNSIDKALELFAKLREAGRIDLEFERSGKTVQNVYSIR